MRLWARRQSLAGTGVIFVSGGEPVTCCEDVTLLVVAASALEAEARAAEAGVRDPSAWDEDAFRILRHDIDLARDDPRGFAWKLGRARTWQSSQTWPGT